MDEESNEEFIAEFLIECRENLEQLDRDLVALENEPRNPDLLASIFRTVHTIKGTSGFFGYAKLGALTHSGENLLGRLRSGEVALNTGITGVLLDMVDAVRVVLANIEKTGEEGDVDYRALAVRMADLATEDTGPVEGPVSIQPPDEKQRIQIADRDPLMVRLASANETLTEMAASIPERLADTPPAPAADAPATPVVAETSIRVGVGLLNEVVDLVGELVLARNQLCEHASHREDSTLTGIAQRLSHITSTLQESALRTRMQPIDRVFSKYPRIVRDLSASCGKPVQLTMSGTDTELDRSLLEAIRDPLTHLVRNAIDHGIEPPDVRESRGKAREGQLALRAYQQSGMVVIEFQDDGGGIDPDMVAAKAVEKGLMTTDQANACSVQERIQLIFQPGFSTASRVTNVSGRGVGMDVVRSGIERSGGTVDLTSHLGEGSTIRIRLPLTLAIIPALIITCRSERLAVPLAAVHEVVGIPPERVATAFDWVHDAPVFRLRGRLLPMVFLGSHLRICTADDILKSDQLTVVVVDGDYGKFGIVVDSVVNAEEIVVKPLGRFLEDVTEYAGATLMGDGGVVLILDVLGLARQSGVASSREEIEAESTDKLLPALDVDTRSLYLLCESASGRKLAFDSECVMRVEQIEAGAIERAAGGWVANCRGRLLPLVWPADEPTHDERIGAVTVIVPTPPGDDFGVVVERVIDALPPESPVVNIDDPSGVSGTVILNGHAADVLDVRELRPGTLPEEGAVT